MALFFVFLSAASRSWQQVQPIYAKTVTQMHIEKEKIINNTQIIDRS